MATSSTAAAISFSVGVPQTYNLQSEKFRRLCGLQSQLAIGQTPRYLKSRRSSCIRAEYSDGSRSGNSGDFVAGFLLGGAVFGTLAYIFAPQIRRSLLNEDDHGFRRAKRPTYYDDGLEKTRETLNAKISQLNSAIDNVSFRLKSSLRGGNNAVPEAVDADSEMEASV